MPIRPENKGRYPAEWADISARIRFERAGGRCECEGECETIRGRTPKHEGRCTAQHGHPHPRTRSRVVLTTAHLNEPIEDCSDENLKAMCQACHLAYDRELHEANRKRSASAQRQLVLQKAGQMAFDMECETGRKVAR